MAITGTLIVFIKLITYKFCSSESYLLAIAACAAASLAIGTLNGEHDT